MVTDTEGLVLRQIKAANGRRMIVILTKRYGKISAGTSLSEGGKNKTALALRPFTYGRYELFKARESFSINGAETLQSYYAIGENVEKYMAASYALELTDRMTEEEQPQPALLALLKDFLELLDGRKSAFGTLLIGFQMKALQIAGCAPQLDRCMRCGSDGAQRRGRRRHLRKLRGSDRDGPAGVRAQPGPAVRAAVHGGQAHHRAERHWIERGCGEETPQTV